MPGCLLPASSYKIVYFLFLRLLREERLELLVFDERELLLLLPDLEAELLDEPEELRVDREELLEDDRDEPDRVDGDDDRLLLRVELDERPVRAELEFDERPVDRLEPDLEDVLEVLRERMAGELVRLLLLFEPETRDPEDRELRLVVRFCEVDRV